ncbi:hypothetical protein RDABS01_029530 [Bienertia sinuspersici]
MFFNTLINCLVHSNNLDHAVKLLDKIVKLGLKPNIFTYGTMFKGLCRIRNHIGALSLLPKMESHGFTNTDHTFSLFNDVIFLRPLPHIIDFNQLLSAMCKIKPFPPFSIVISLYRQLLLLGIRPDNFSLTMGIAIVAWALLIWGFPFLLPSLSLAINPILSP